MARIGLVCPEVSVHLNPTTTLGRAIQRRGHEVVLIGRLDARAAADQAGLGFLAFAEGDYPLGAVAAEVERLGHLTGLAAMRFSVRSLRAAAAAFLRHAPDRIRDARLDLLLVDEVTPAGASVAEALGLPWITVSAGLAARSDPGLPPVFTPWRYRRGWLARWRNRLGNSGTSQQIGMRWTPSRPPRMILAPSPQFPEERRQSCPNSAFQQRFRRKTASRRQPWFPHARELLDVIRIVGAKHPHPRRKSLH